MLQIQNIRKQYVTGDLTQVALNDVSLNLRDNEFVAILGPSGSGKTTLLNVIGGLDRYDSGDLIINGISTKQYKDRDWDSYRNHTIGFVFQSYNLIPHQTVLANVELALTISGISRAERKRRAIEALTEVGLGEQLHKKPNQMSGGQMQRVAIARALVNNPDIVLADEPTGALDTETSVQVMELLKQVAKDRLVVMVTHNPELAEEYATRIVKLRDGRIIDDSDPYEVDAAAMQEPEHKNMGHSSMSFLTSLLLSFNNLRTKKGRTILTAFAGSIGIIGIALILSLSNGANTYIHNIEEETLSEYPLTIQSTSMDISAFMQNAASSRMEDVEEGKVMEWRTVSAMFSRVSTNDLKSLKQYLDTDIEIHNHAKAIEYSYGVSPRIYRLNDDDSYRQVNPDQALSYIMGNNYSMASSMMNTDPFAQLPDNEELYQSQYEILTGHWPENKNECVVVLSEDSRITDLVLYALGLKDAAELDEMIEKFYKNEDTDIDAEPGLWNYEDFIGIETRVVNPSSLYEYDAEHDVYLDKTDNADYMRKLISNSDTLTVVGVARPREDSTVAMLTPAVYYTPELTMYLMDQAADSEIVQKQLADPDTDVFTGANFRETVQNTLDMSELFQVDEDAIAKAFGFNENALNMDGLDFSDMDLSGLDFSGMDLSGIDLSGLDFSGLDLSRIQLDPSSLSDLDLASLLENVNIEVNQEELKNLFQQILTEYLAEAAKDPTTDYNRIGEGIGQYLRTERAFNLLKSGIKEIFADIEIKLPDESTVLALLEDLLNDFVSYVQEQDLTALAEDPSLLQTFLSEFLQTDTVQAKIAGFLTGIREDNQDIGVSDEAVRKLLQSLYEDYDAYAEENELPMPSKLMESFLDYLGSDTGKQTLTDGISKVVNLEEIEQQIGSAISSAMTSVMTEVSSQIGSSLQLQLTGTITQAMTSVMNSVMNSVSTQLTRAITDQMGTMMTKIADGMQEAISVDVDAFAGAINISMDPEQLQELMMSMMTSDTASYDGNLSKLGYADKMTPSLISIYPIDFDSKEVIMDLLDDYNARMEDAGEDEKVISYTDYVGTLMSSVTDIIDTISYVLVAFVAISLIVSSIMIGIITYISVLERTKEIGILRAIGASKRNISQVFNAETFIIGLLSGVLGIGISLLLLIPGNALIHHAAGNTSISAILPFGGAVALIIISVLLTLIGGLIPSRKAAKKDPVTALRSE